VYNFISNPHGVLGEVVKRCKNHVSLNHEKNNEHKITIVKWEITHFLSFDMALMFKHVQHILKKNIPKPLFT
jgi:hypothetical protein